MKTKTTTLLLALLLSMAVKAQTLTGYFLANGDTIQGFTEFFFCTDSCYNFSFAASGGTPPYSYLWSTGSTTDHTTLCYSDLQPNNDDTLLVRVTDSNSHEESFFLRAQEYPEILQQICLVTVDTALNKNLIIWQQNTNPDVMSYNIYKETTTLNQFALIGVVPRDSLSVFTDTTSNPAQVSARYTMTAVSLCAASHFVSFHKTMHLTINTGINNTWNLIWENYSGDNSAVKYRIWRGSTANGLELIDSVSPTVTTYTDLTPPAGILFYSLEMIPSYTCQPGTKDILYTSSFSNKVDNASLLAINEKEPLTHKVIISPNPLIHSTSITFSHLLNPGDYTLEICDMHGHCIKTYSDLTNRPLLLNRSDFKSTGIYLVRIKSPLYSEILKLLVL